MFTAGALALAGFVAACRRSPPFPAAPVALHPGLQYREVACSVGGNGLRLRELRGAPGSGVQLRALLNPTARTLEGCAQRYGGRDVREIVRGIAGFDVLGATNGNFFHRLGDGRFRSNGMIWSLADRDGSALLAPVQPTIDPDFRGDRVFVADARGGWEVRIATGACEPGACRVSVAPGSTLPPDSAASLARHATPMSQDEFVMALREAFPSATLAMQVNHGYADRGPGAGPNEGWALAESFRCSPQRQWTCRPHAVTLLCATSANGVSLLTSEEVQYADLVPALRPGGACGLGCERLYILDGGGSAQIGIRDGAAGGFSVRYAGKRDADPPAGCAEYRPVDHYLAFGTTRAP